MKMFRKLGPVMVGNVAAAMIMPAAMLLFGRERSAAVLWSQFYSGLVYSMCIGTPACLVLDRVGARIMSLPPWLRLAGLVGTLCGFATAGALAANVIFVLLGWAPAEDFRSNLKFGLRVSIAITLLLGMSLTVYETLSHRLHAAALEVRTRQLAEERHRKLASEARLSSLESRIHPHFLFNTLNSISALIREDPAQAERTVERLAALLRYSLDSNARRLVSLRQELRVVEDYLQIEKTRFGDRLRYTLDAAEGIDDLEVPPLALQTLVENSIKHAVAPNRQGGEIRVTARLDGEYLRLEVTDDGPGFDAGDVKQGHGLENLQERLAALFDGAGRLELGRGDGGMTVSVAMPQRKVPA